MRATKSPDDFLVRGPCAPRWLDGTGPRVWGGVCPRDYSPRRRLKTGRSVTESTDVRDVPTTLWGRHVSWMASPSPASRTTATHAVNGVHFCSTSCCIEHNGPTPAELRDTGIWLTTCQLSASARLGTSLSIRGLHLVSKLSVSMIVKHQQSLLHVTAASPNQNWAEPTSARLTLPEVPPCLRGAGGCRGCLCSFKGH